MILKNTKEDIIICESELQQLLKQPESAISKYNLIYTYEADLSIIRKSTVKASCTIQQWIFKLKKRSI